MNKKNILIIVVIAIIAIIVIVGLILFMSNKNKVKTDNPNKTANNENSINSEDENNLIEEETNMYSTGKHHAEIVVKNYGTIALELDADVAPITVANFAKLANEGFYNGLTFHRIIEGFMVQGGDPLGNGTGGSDENIKGEFSKNGVKNDISHVRGTISMARSSMPNSASSQFFIVHEDSTFLDGSYAGFGSVTSGMEVVDKIAEEAKVEDSNGTVSKENQPVIEKITMID